jgi:hypothetical protein
VNFGTILNKGTINLKNRGAIYLGSSGEPIFPDLPGIMNNLGKVNIDSTSGFALTNADSVLKNAGTIDNSNILRIKSGTLNNSGEINNKAGATIQNSAVINNRNHGVINDSGSITNYKGVDGTINEYCGSLLNNQGEGTVTGNTIIDKCK